MRCFDGAFLILCIEIPLAGAYFAFSDASDKGVWKFFPAGLYYIRIRALDHIGFTTWQICQPFLNVVFAINSISFPITVLNCFDFPFVKNVVNVFLEDISFERITCFDVEIWHGLTTLRTYPREVVLIRWLCQTIKFNSISFHSVGPVLTIPVRRIRTKSIDLSRDKITRDRHQRPHHRARHQQTCDTAHSCP